MPLMIDHIYFHVFMWIDLHIIWFLPSWPVAFRLRMSFGPVVFILRLSLLNWLLTPSRLSYWGLACWNFLTYLSFRTESLELTLRTLNGQPLLGASLDFLCSWNFFDAGPNPIVCSKVASFLFLISVFLSIFSFFILNSLDLLVQLIDQLSLSFPSWPLIWSFSGMMAKFKALTCGTQNRMYMHKLI